MTDYHFHHPEKMFTDRAELLEIIAGQRLMTLAMANDGQPYLITVNYGFDAEQDCFYFHCAPEGKKLDYLRANPNVWGQVVENRGYVTGKCDHAYRSVHFAGQVDFLEDDEEKRSALTLMIRQMEPDPGPLEQRLAGAGEAGQNQRRPGAGAGDDRQTERAGIALTFGAVSAARALTPVYRSPYPLDTVVRRKEDESASHASPGDWADRHPGKQSGKRDVSPCPPHDNLKAAFHKCLSAIRTKGRTQESDKRRGRHNHLLVDGLQPRAARSTRSSQY